MPSAALCPGIAQGVYPERREERGNALERAVHALRGAVTRRRNAIGALEDGLLRREAFEVVPA